MGNYRQQSIVQEQEKEALKDSKISDTCEMSAHPQKGVSLGRPANKPKVEANLNSLQTSQVNFDPFPSLLNFISIKESKCNQ